MNCLKLVLIGLFAVGAFPLLCLSAGNMSLLPLALLQTAFWAGFLYWLWRV